MRLHHKYDQEKEVETERSETTILNIKIVIVTKETKQKKLTTAKSGRVGGRH